MVVEAAEVEEVEEEDTRASITAAVDQMKRSNINSNLMDKEKINNLHPTPRY